MRVGPRIYKHPDGRWEARYRKGRREDGSILYGSVYGSSYEEAEQRRAEILHEMTLRAENGASAEAAAIVASNQLIREYYTATPRAKTAYPDPLDAEELEQFIRYLPNLRDNERLALSLSLYMGVSGEELAALRYSDVDLAGGHLYISRRMSDGKQMLGAILPCETRSVVIPQAAWKYAAFAPLIASGGDKYILTDSETPVKSLRMAKNLWGRLLANVCERKITPEVLRATFIRRCFASGINTETVARITGLSSPTLRSKYGHFAAANPSVLERLEYRDDTPAPRVREMNLLILGAGSHGHAVYEIAEKSGMFQKIAFLDDHVVDARVVGRLEDCARLRDEYPLCFIAIGNNRLRKWLAERVTEAGFITPRLISAETSIAKGVQIGRGSIIMPQATLNTGAVVGDFCIVASNTLIGFNATVEDYAHCDCASVVMKDCTVHALETIESGEIVKEKREIS